MIFGAMLCVLNNLQKQLSITLDADAISANGVPDLNCEKWRKYVSAHCCV